MLICGFYFSNGSGFVVGVLKQMLGTSVALFSFPSQLIGCLTSLFTKHAVSVFL